MKTATLKSIACAPRARGLDDHIAVRVARIAELVTRLASRTIEARWKLSNTDLRLLNILDGTEPLPVSEVSRRSHVDKAWVSRSLRQLQKRGLVSRSRHATDTRLSLVGLTTHGQSLLNEVRPDSLRNESRLLQGVNARALKAMLDRLETNAAALLSGLQRGDSSRVRKPR